MLLLLLLLLLLLKRGVACDKVILFYCAVPALLCSDLVLRQQYNTPLCSRPRAHRPPPSFLRVAFSKRRIPSVPVPEPRGHKADSTTSNPLKMAFMEDPHWDDTIGPVPPWAPDAGKRWKKGQSKGCWIWPRDQKMTGPPLGSSRRWKDVLSGKGPPVYFGNRTRFGPTKNTWSNWIDPAFDNLGYRDEHHMDNLARQPDYTRAYDFKKRRWTKNLNSPEVWSDVKWGKDKWMPLYVRNGLAQEWTLRNGFVNPYDNTALGNDFRYRGHTNFWDRQRPWPQEEWRDVL